MAAVLFLIGGGDYRKDELADINKLVVKSAEIKKMLVIPFATQKEKRGAWFDAVRSSFTKIGIHDFDMLSEEDTSGACIDKIKKAGILFLTGGEPALLVGMIKSKRLETCISAYDGVIVGISAGALALCDDCIITKDEDHSNSTIITGLGFVNFSVDVHYDPANDNDLLSFSKTKEIYALTDKSAIIYGNHQLQFIGDIFLFKKMNKSRVVPKNEI